jgi:hypothetical protein
VALCGVPCTLVVPRKWQAMWGLKGNDKEGHRQAAIRLIPNAHALLKRKLDHQRADALLIALYGWTVLDARRREAA